MIDRPPAPWDGPLAMSLIRRRLVTAALLFAVVFATGTTGFWFLGRGEWSLLDCAYFVLITLAAVGYEETLPVRQTAAGTAFTMGLIICGMGVPTTTWGWRHCTTSRRGGEAILTSS